MKIYCANCGAETNCRSSFCESCGQLIKAQTKTPPPQSAGKTDGGSRLVPDGDGKYRWNYELNLFTNPTVFITLCKLFGGVILGCGLFIGLLSGQEFAETLRFILVVWGLGLGGFLVIGGLAYVVYSTVQGGKYCVIFEMDRKTVTHIQMQKQFEKAQVIAALTALTGAVEGSPSIAGTGILAGSRRSMTTRFDFVNKIKIKRCRHVIYLHEGLSWNQIYAPPDSFDAVLDYILSRIPETAKRKGI